MSDRSLYASAIAERPWSFEGNTTRILFVFVLLCGSKVGGLLVALRLVVMLQWCNTNITMASHFIVTRSKI